MPQRSYLINKVAVTGGLGFIGHQLVAKLLMQGYNVDIIDSYDPLHYNPAKYNWLFRERLDYVRNHTRAHTPYAPVKLEVYNCHYLDYSMSTRAPDIVIHTAFPCKPDWVKERSDVDFNNRLDYSNQLVELLNNCTNAGVKMFINLSSSQVITDLDADYGKIKRLGEIIVDSFNDDSKMKTVNVRPSAVIGPRDNDLRLPIIIFQNLYENLAIDINSNCYRNFTPNSILADNIIILIIKRYSLADGPLTYNAFSNYSYNIRKFVEVAVALTDNISTHINWIPGPSQFINQLLLKQENYCNYFSYYTHAKNLRYEIKEIHDWFYNSPFRTCQATSFN